MAGPAAVGEIDQAPFAERRTDGIGFLILDRLGRKPANDRRENAVALQ